MSEEQKKDANTAKVAATANNPEPKLPLIPGSSTQQQPLAASQGLYQVSKMVSQKGETAEEEAGNKSVVFEDNQEELGNSVAKAFSECNPEHSFVEPTDIVREKYYVAGGYNKAKNSKKARKKEKPKLSNLMNGKLLFQKSEPNLPIITPSFSRRNNNNFLIQI